MLRLCNNNGIKTLNLINYTFSHTLFYSSSSLGSIKVIPSLASYLVNTLGFSKQQARSTSAKFERLRHIQQRKRQVSSAHFAAKANSVVKFLKENGLTGSQVRIVVSTLPQVLLSNVDHTLKPKVDSFLKLGFSKPDIGEVVVVNPFVLQSAQFLKAIEPLREVLKCDEDVIYVMKKSSWRAINSMVNNLLPNVALMRSYGVSMDAIRGRLLRRTVTIFLRKTDAFKDTLVRVEDYLGVPRDSPRFLDAVHLLSSISEKNIESKIRMFESFGWTRLDVIALVGRNPNCLALSEANLKKSLEYLMGELGYDLAYLLSHSALLGYSLEKRIVPRNKVLLALKEKGLIRMDYSLYTTLSLTEPQFCKRYVFPFEEVHQVYAKYTYHSPVEPLTSKRR